MTRCRREGLPATLVTRDKDFAQLIRDGDVYWDYSDNAHYRYHQIEERFGVAPERFADFLALMGDSVDNIKGVPGVGSKTAAALMKEFASLEELYDNLDQVADIPVRGAGKLAAKLAEHREAAYLARRLTEIACDMPLEIAHAELTRRAPDVAALTEFFDRHNFGPMLRRQAERLALAAAARRGTPESFDVIPLFGGTEISPADAFVPDTAGAVFAHGEVATHARRRRCRPNCRNSPARCPSRLRRGCRPNCPVRTLTLPSTFAISMSPELSIVHRHVVAHVARCRCRRSCRAPHAAGLFDARDRRSCRSTSTAPAMRA